ncbi:beta family protein [Rhodoferax ferrireducens]|uniref:beta family protein n=1 Tax=Rhodoferax ferrireducens TaxID=192843 RepID=UPI0013001EF5|nr:beta family protein [Rhodoferax ferrireducens]
MLPKYIPLLKAMNSESIALANIDPVHAKKMLPLFEVPRIGPNILEAKRFVGCPTPTTAYLDEVTNRIAKVWSGRTAMVDAYQWPADATVESGEHVLPYLFTRLQALGVDVVPVIGYDRWENPTYSLAMQGLELPGTPYYCLRLDAQALEDAAEPDFFLENIEAMLARFELEPGACSVLIDFGDVTGRSVEKMVGDSDAILNLLMPLGFRYFASAGCSLPKSIDLAVKKPDTVGKVVRKEMLLWQAARQQYPDSALVYGDYGIRGPSSNEGIPNPHGNGKIRHTIDKHFLVVRGHSMMLPGKGEQMWGLAQKVVASPHYLGANFSWGDQQILDCSQKKIKGHHAQWISNDTSHHLAYALAEVEQFDLSVAVPAPVSVKTSGKIA